MQAILNVKASEIDESLLNLIRELFSKNIEIVIRKETFILEEYDRTLPLSEAMKDFEKAGYSEAFLKNLKEGFETSTVYAGKNENQTLEKRNKKISKKTPA